jgi:hypothetical protein
VKKNNTYTWLCLIIVIIADGCIDRYEIPEKIVIPRLVVDGMITNKPGPYTVELFTAYDVNTLINKPNPVTKATVQISDDAGNTETLTEVSPGMYMTASDGIQGEIGRSYQLSITTEAGHYSSEPQLLTGGGELLDLRYEFDQFAISSSGGKAEPAVNFFIDAQGIPGQQNYFRWRWSSVYETVNNPELKTIFVGKNAVEVASPPPCSGYQPAGGKNIKRIDICTCCNCWVYEAGKTAVVSKNSSVAEDKFVNVRVANVAMADRRFDVRYYFKLDQLSVSEEVYNFWKLVEAQQLGEGSLFQPNAVRVQGNIRSTTNPNEQVLGVFSVSGIVSREVYVDRKEIPFTIEVETVPESCLLRPGATNTKPLFW